ncbi:MAG TPA: bifunctional DNA-binding transcriptional regulator/O6-methylguanine-DNA methyltransferase Ada [Thermoanaerobaculia bacterium]|jgi:AraC family transcriptional regulator of adaptative response/methylated-DNA-[protein]-cysteine methyltransferase|nr:bifunctional DNA-binding transcriptional regulator/O6-methylguanine-DNA methyltransferase Ada [Thermoanaerobaculia bacterium]
MLTATVMTQSPMTPRSTPQPLLKSLPSSPRAKALDEEAAWAAVIARDRGQDGRFVFAVASTGIYCRPSCPARRPLRERVSFFAEPAEAITAGFRACRRCRPGEVASDAALAGKVRALLDEAAEDPEGGSPTLARLAHEVGASPSHLQRIFTRVLGISPREYLAARRAERLKGHLRSGGSVTDALYDAGYSGSSRLYEQADGRLGMPPGAYRRGGEGIKLRFTIAESTLGRVLLAATDRGIAAVALGDSDEALEGDLRREYPNAEITGHAAPAKTDPELAAWAAPVLAALEGASADLADLPLDLVTLRASAFAFRVWRELRKIPRGETRTYGEIAAAVGSPGAARAVGTACAANPAALVIPCHRVVRGDGASGGYRWGQERKARLLEQEGVRS